MEKEAKIKTIPGLSVEQFYNGKDETSVYLLPAFKDTPEKFGDYNEFLAWRDTVGAKYEYTKTLWSCSPGEYAQMRKLEPEWQQRQADRKRDKEKETQREVIQQ